MQCYANLEGSAIQRFGHYVATIAELLEKAPESVKARNRHHQSRIRAFNQDSVLVISHIANSMVTMRGA